MKQDPDENVKTSPLSKVWRRLCQPVDFWRAMEVLGLWIAAGVGLLAINYSTRDSGRSVEHNPQPIERYERTIKRDARRESPPGLGPLVSNLSTRTMLKNRCGSYSLIETSAGNLPRMQFSTEPLDFLSSLPKSKSRLYRFGKIRSNLDPDDLCSGKTPSLTRRWPYYVIPKRYPRYK